MAARTRPMELVDPTMATLSVTHTAHSIPVDVVLSMAGVEIQMLTVVLVAFLAALLHLPRAPSLLEETADAALNSVVQLVIQMEASVVAARSMDFAAILMITVLKPMAARTAAPTVETTEEVNNRLQVESQ